MPFYAPNTILAAVERTYRVTRSELTGPRRHKNLADARRCAGYFLAIAGNRNNDEIAAMLSRSPSWASQARWGFHDEVSVDKAKERMATAVYRALEGVAA